ncbi:LOW QUALITY PROTEIN: hypothetical protein ACHAXS_009358 [Conticribra weissflogii]
MESKLSLKEGEKIHINLVHRQEGGGYHSKAIQKISNLKLPPPPGVTAPPSSVDAEITKSESNEETKNGDDDTGPEKKETSNEEVEWGDFEG